jgi:hypothetical protein
MAFIGTVPTATECGEGLNEILMGGDILPGDTPSYQLCKTIYLFHPLGGKIVEQPVKMAQSQERLITIEDSPGEEVKEAFEQARKDIRADYYIRGCAFTARIYGVGTLACGTIGQSPEQPLQMEKLHSQRPYLVVMDALNTAGSIVLNQNPNDPMFQKVQGVAVSGVPWHQSRACVLFNEQPVYLSYTSSAFGFSGRSVFQRALYPLKSFIRTMITDDMVAQKAGLLIVFMKAAGSVVNALQQAAANLKRFLLKIAGTGEVLSVGHEDRVESVDMQNIDKSLIAARSNIIKNIATAVPMPAQIIEQESFAEGFGEGTEDTKNIVRFVNEVRDELQPLYTFTDAICQRLAWTPQFIQAMRTKYKELYRGKSDDEIFYAWKNKFKATWPNLLEEPESEKSKQEKVKLEGLVEIYQALASSADESNKAALAEWVQANCNEYRNLFPVPMAIDPDGMVEEPDMNMLEAQAKLAPSPAGKPGLKSVSK